MAKILRINTCWDCPSHSLLQNGNEQFLKLCRKYKKEISLKSFHPPVYCKLKDDGKKIEKAKCTGDMPRMSEKEVQEILKGCGWIE